MEAGYLGGDPKNCHRSGDVHQERDGGHYREHDSHYRCEHLDEGVWKARTCFGIIPLDGRGGWDITHQLASVCSRAAHQGFHPPALWSALCEGPRSLQLEKTCRCAKKEQ